jgi:hypothetical protein
MATNLEWIIRLDDRLHVVTLWDDQQWGAFQITVNEYIELHRHFRLSYRFSYTFDLCGHRCCVRQTMYAPYQTGQWSYQCLLDGKPIEPENTSLLRASQPPDLLADTLLRPAGASLMEDISTLLRPEATESAEDHQS